MEHTKHIWRAFLLLLALLVVAIVGRHFLIPDTFGQEGFYRYAAVSEFMALPAVHGNLRSCAKCHEKEQELQDDGPHAPVSCAECHGPVTIHAKGEEKIADMPSNDSYQGCENCHRKLAARPQAAIKQIDVREHLDSLGVLEPGEPIPRRSCVVCHDAHSTKEK